MKFQRLALLICCGFSVMMGRGEAATIILGDGADLPAAVAAAKHRDVIELRSNGPFAGVVTWEDKYLTIQASRDYQPIIEGPVQNIAGNSLTGGTFRGLIFNGSFRSSGTGDDFASIVIEDSTLNDQFGLGGTGRFHVDATIRDSRLLGRVSFGGTGEFSLDAILERNLIADAVGLSTISQAVHRISFLDNEFLERAFTGGTQELVFTRNRLRRGLQVSLEGSNRTVINASDNVIGPDSVQPPLPNSGILLGYLFEEPESLAAEFVNNTVFGFDIGIDIRGVVRPEDIQFTNMLLNNQDDLSNVGSDTISYSLISDGTFDGQNHNFAGNPLLGENGQLLAGSIGIDRGSNASAGAVDFAGNPRILDGNSDGIDIVDVGAYEFVVPEPATWLLAIGAALLLTLRRHF